LPDAVAGYEKANATDPLFPPAWYWLGRTRAAMGDYAGAKLALNRTLAVAPEFSTAQSYLGVVALLQGDAAGAREIFSRTNRALGLAMAEHDLGNAAESERLLQDAIREHANDNAYSIGAAYAWIGNADAAFKWLDAALEHHDDGLQYVKYDPLLRSIRSDPRYPPMLRRLNLPE
jgi:tetratricopeptide (TPR) repeat protein